MPLINALRRMHVSLAIARSRAAALVRRVICVAVLSEENQKLMPLVPCSTPRGGILKVSERPSVDRRRLCCTNCPRNRQGTLQRVGDVNAQDQC
jgi:hypothetical protein